MPCYLKKFTNISPENIEVYNIICDSIGIEPKANNGTLRLPLKPVGLHSDDPSSVEDRPTDFSPDEVSPSALESAEASKATSVSGGKVTVIEVDKATGEQKETKVEMSNLWSYFKSKMAAAQAWANKVIAGLKNHHEESEKESGSFDQGDHAA